MNSEHSAALQACQRGIDQSVRNQADAMKHIDLAITKDNSYCLPHVIKAWMLHGANDESYKEQISAQVELAQQRLPEGVSKESCLLDALKSMQLGQRVEGTHKLAALCQQYPTDAYLQMLAQEETFWLGEAKWMHAITEQAAPHWKNTSKDYGPLLAIRAFANEEAGFYDAAQRYGMESVEIDATDVWGAHAVAHVFLMKGEFKQGIQWLDGLSENWGNANQMQHHLWWHYCLFLLETREHDKILELLHTKIRNPESRLIKASPAATIDINNYASLVMRLELYGVDVAELWQNLSVVCSARTDNHASVFSNIHDMMVLGACGNFAQATQLLFSMSERYQDESTTGSIGAAYREVGIPVCKAVLAHRKKDYARVISLLGDVRHQLYKMGASHAQRDVFYHMLVDAARKEQRTDLEKQYLSDIERLGFCDVPKRAAYC